ncbi:FAD:protein FMN transferase [Bacteriovorax sp. DB6_IX]|uniref:FAD:protein FMN transferase n=1 Tax=Bacteriovorax sp. DB6_IX TaxID=1353530 RepID=UPI00038A1C29|nr:FAD:protein FMN transferase [Bacteriovorax sp. DB6_IX]EQC52284.1 ApbE family protein [Bacteriovorax sp. DB6_IX]
MRFFSLAILFLLVACQGEVGIKVHHIKGRTMGTTYNIKFVAPAEYDAKGLQLKVDQRLKEVNMSMSTYIPESEISKVNQSKANEKIKISQDFNTVLSHALDLAVKTEGVFDPTIGPLVNLWGFGPKGERIVPSDEKITETRQFVGYEKVTLEKSVVTKSLDKVYIDLSASAKGYGVDQITKLLRENGLRNTMVEIGGEVRAEGKSAKRPWKIGVEIPSPDPAKMGVLKVVQVEGFALATSGSYRNYFKYGDKSYSHTINYQTGKPVDHTLLSVSVISDNCMDADAKATALMAMGDKKGYEFATKNGIKAYFVFKDPTGQKLFDQKFTPGFESVVK